LARAVSRREWDALESRVERNTRRVLELFARRQVRGTFFVLGWVAHRYPAIVREIHGAGHEVGCHSYWHRCIYRLTPEEFRADTLLAKKAIEDATGEAVLGYRAPTFSVVRRSLWALDILAELGFQYDSSIFPVRHDNYGIPDYSRFFCRHQSPNGESLTELPLSTFTVMGTNLPFGGGGYLRILPLRYTHFGFRRVNRDGKPVVVYFHPWEIDPDQPRLKLGPRARFRHYANLNKMEARVDELLRAYRFAPLAKLPELTAASSPPSPGAN
jgi:polysaccharide deacetylase family protein (PEP-CTERM system associated)